jgi:hypothetical protein
LSNFAPRVREAVGNINFTALTAKGTQKPGDLILSITASVQMDSMLLIDMSLAPNDFKILVDSSFVQREDRSVHSKTLVHTGVETCRTIAFDDSRLNPESAAKTA